MNKYEETLSSISNKDDVGHKETHTVTVDSRASEQAMNKLLYFDKLQTFQELQLKMAEG